MAKTPEEILEEARKHIGRETRSSQGRYPVEYDPIRRFCHMSGDANPLFLDPEYARKTKHGEVVCPPLFVGYFGSGGLWPPSQETTPKRAPALPDVPTPGDKAINMSTDWEFFRPVKVGDRLSSVNRIADVFIKAIRLDPKAFWIVTEATYSNQYGEVVAKSRNTLLVHRSAEQQKADGN